MPRNPKIRPGMPSMNEPPIPPNSVQAQHSIGTYSGNFSFVIYLRPWGDEWPESSRPDGYEAFYLPKVEAKEPMPDSFD